jgi:hypothetical protein
MTAHTMTAHSMTAYIMTASRAVRRMPLGLRVLRVLRGLVLICLAALLAGLAAATPRGLAPPLAAQGPAPSDPAREFVGHWRLVSFVNVDASGVASDAGYAGGRIMYDAAGHMAAQLMRSNRRPTSQPPTGEERAAAYASFVAYYGAYTIDPVAHSVTHRVEGALNPNWVGTDLVRYYELSPDGRRLMLSLRNAQGRTTSTLTWERIAAR